MQILQLLADGGLHSGEELGRLLGISRAAVWKRIDALRKKGVVVEVVPGKGYRLATPVEPWSQERLLSHLRPASRDMVSILRIEDRVASTNDLVAALMREGGGKGVICLAEEQTAGRGRRGRQWFSPPGSNFYGSIGWTFDEGLSAVEGLSLATGVAIARALTRYGLQGVELKWPNDLQVRGAKLGGVLIEVQAEAGGSCQVVVGIGVNLALPASAATMLGRAVTDVVTHTPGTLSRNRLGGLILDEVLALLRCYPETGFRGVREEWQRYDALRGLDVVVEGLAEPWSGVVQGVDERGALQLQTSQGLKLVHGGEVSLRKASG